MPLWVTTSLVALFCNRLTTLPSALAAVPYVFLRIVTVKHRIIRVSSRTGSWHHETLFECHLNVVASGRVGLKPLVTDRFKLDAIEEAYTLSGSQRDGVLKIAISPWNEERSWERKCCATSGNPVSIDKPCTESENLDIDVSGRHQLITRNGL